MKRSRLGAGQKSLDRGSTFAKPRSELTRSALARVVPLKRRSRRRRRGRPTDEQILAKQSAACWLAQFSDEPCSGPMQLCHLIAKQRLRQNHVPENDIWDERVVVNGCEAHHVAVPLGLIPRDELPPGLEEYAAEHEMTWSLDYDFGVAE